MHDTQARRIRASTRRRGGYRNSAGEWLCGETERETPGQIAVRARRRELWTLGSFGRRRAAFALEKAYRKFPRWLGVFVSSAHETTRLRARSLRT